MTLLTLLFLSWYTANQQWEVLRFAQKTTQNFYERTEPVEYPKIVGEDSHYNPVKIRYISESLERDADCIAKMVYHEARGTLFTVEGDENNRNVFLLSDIDGFRAHFSVVLERVESNMFPQDVCGVVFQDGQFSSSLNNKKQKYNDEILTKLKEQALIHLLYGYRLDETDSALFFDSNKKTKRKIDYNRTYYKVKTKEIAGHSFYKLEQK